MRTQTILSRVYRLPPARRHRPRLLQRVGARIRGWLKRNDWKLVLLGLAASLWVSTHVYYYNQLINYEFNVKAAWAQVEAVQQKRNHIQRNLTTLLAYYAKYERDLMTDVTTMRTSKGAKEAGDDSLFQMLGKLQAVAEQYPNPQLTANVQQLSGSVINTEAEIAARIMDYNNAVNQYTTVLNMFPGNVFGAVLGFESAEYYVPEDMAVLDYRVIEMGEAK